MTGDLKTDVFEGLFLSGLEKSFLSDAEALPSDNELAKMYPAPKRIPRRFKREIKRKKYGRSPAAVYLTRAAMALLFALLLSFAAIASDKGVRKAVSETVVSWFGRYTEIDLGKNGEKGFLDDKEIRDLSVGYIPGGYAIERRLEEGFARYFYYSDQNGGRVVVTISASDGSGVVIDDDAEGLETVKIGDYTAYIYFGSGEDNGSLTFGNRKTTVHIYGSVGKEEMIRMAEGIS